MSTGTYKKGKRGIAKWDGAFAAKVTKYAKGRFG